MCRKMTISLTPSPNFAQFLFEFLTLNGTKCIEGTIDEYKDDKNRHFVLLIIDISKHGAKEMGHVKMAGPGYTFRSIQCEKFKEKLSEIRGWGQADRHFAAH
jgi:hypothetical protein